MTFHEIKQALGDWDLVLKEETPRGILAALTPLGHIAVVPGRVPPAQYGDNLLKLARYVGVLRNVQDDQRYTLKGAGMAFWLGDEDDKGSVFENAVTAASATFANAIRAVLPSSGAVTEGTLTNVAGLLTQTWQWTTPRKAIQFITDTYSTSTSPVSWRVNGDGTLDAGPDTALFVTSPQAILVANGEEGRDLRYAALPGGMQLTTDVEDYTTRVVLLAQGDGAATAVGSANVVSTPYKDIHGNTVKLVRMVSESETGSNNATARAQLALNRFSSPRQAVTLDSDGYDVKGDFSVGDTIWVYDPDNGFYDIGQEIIWQGVRINPIAMPVVEMTSPISSGWTVAFRDTNGIWLDLSDYYIGEGGSTTVVVGGFNRSVDSIGSEPVGSRPVGDSSIPATPAFVVPFSTVAYQSQAANDVRAAVLVTWTQPLNQDGSTIVDGDHYEIRYRTTQTFSYPITWSQASGFTWSQMGTWARPLSNPAAVAHDWQTVIVGWGTTSQTITELTVAAEYEFQIRAVDGATPPNQSQWSSSVFVTTRGDVIAPSVPAAPVVASNLVSLQVVHTLGKATGGTYNLESDLDHLEVHAGHIDFFPDDSTRLGRLIANQGLMTGQIPAVGSFTVANADQLYVKVVAVDRFGNKSGASAQAAGTVQLISSQFISELTASKITAGTITSDVLVSGRIATALSGERVEINSEGVQVFDPDGNAVINLTADPSTVNFITIQDDNGNTLSSLDDSGNVSGQTLNAADAIVLAGADLATTLTALPKGFVAQGVITTNPAVSGTTTELGIMEISFTADATRAYEIRGYYWAFSTVAGDQITMNIRDGGSSPPLVSSPIIARSSHCVGTANFGETFLCVTVPTFTAGQHRLLLTIARERGSGTVNLSATTTQQVELTVEDVGLAQQNLAVLNDGSGVSTPTAPAPVPVQQVTRNYSAVWTANFGGDNLPANTGTTDANQGFYSGSGHGNQRSLVGFDYAAIMRDLAGATVNAISITGYAKHWYSNSGGFASIGFHTYTGKPGSWSSSNVFPNQVQSGKWPNGAVLNVGLPTSYGTGLRDGTVRGIAFGPGPTTSTDYYGRFSGVGDPSYGTFYLTITYTK